MLCVVMWSLALSHMSAWRDLQQAGQAIRRKMNWKPVRVAGIDGAWVNGKGIMVAVDMVNYWNSLKLTKKKRQRWKPGCVS